MKSERKKQLAKKRNQKRRDNPEWTEEEWLALKSVLRWCQRCQSEKNLTMDHRIPLSKGGKNSIDNLELLCRECNSKKAAKKLPPSTPMYLLPSQELTLAALPEHLREKVKEALHVASNY